MPLSVGDKLGHYEVLSLLGQGGMGEVYRAKDTKLDRQVAIKVLPSVLARDAERLARFEREAKVLASLDHPNIGHIYGLVDAEDSRALVLALIEGPTLADQIALGALPLDDALSIAKQIIEALEYAHDRGVVHRDLKPANIKITPDGMVKVLDFGLAKVLEDEPPASSMGNSPTLTLGHTRAGVILGTAAYMSPEQAIGRPVDRRSDIFSFGAVLFEMLTGKRAFNGAATPDVLEAVVKFDPDWSALPGETPEYLRRLLDRTLAKDRKERLQAIGEARLTLAKPELDKPDTERALMLQASWPARMLPWVLAAVGIVSASAAAYGWWTASHPAARPLIRLNADLTEPLDLGNSTGSSVAISPDGRRLAFISRDSNGKSRLNLRLLESETVTALAAAGGATGPFFSPDSQWIAFFADGKLKKISVQGGSAVTLCDARNPRGGWWGEDGDILFAAENRAVISRVSSSGGAPRAVTRFNGGETTHRMPQLLPGGEAFLFTSSNDNNGYTDATIEAQTVKTGQRKTLVSGASFGRYLASGHLLYIREGTVFAAPLDLKRLELTGPASPVLENVNNYPARGYADLDSTPSGTVIYVPGAGRDLRTTLVWLDSSGAATPIIADPGDFREPRVSPDGTRIALLAADRGVTNLAIYDIAGRRITRLTFLKSAIQEFFWVPDSKHLVFRSSSKEMAGPGLYWIRADGAGEPQRILEGGEWYPGAISPDGRRLVYYQPGASALWTLPLDVTDSEHPKPGKPEQFLRTDAPVRVAAFSPDGKWLAYGGRDSTSEVFVRPFPGPGGKWQVSSGGGSAMFWSRNGRELLYASPGGRNLKVVEYSVKGDSFVAGQPRLWSEKEFPRFSAGDIDLAPDGKRLAAVIFSGAEERKPSTHVTFLFNFLDELRQRAPVGK